MKAEDRAPRRPNTQGPVGECVQRNIREVREGTSTYELARELEKLGRPISPAGITKIEQGQRRVDVDDLVALAIALGTTPNRLLFGLEGEGEFDYVGLTPERTVMLRLAWEWAQGRTPMLGSDARVKHVKNALRAFQARSLPEFLLSEQLEPSELSKAIEAEIERLRALGDTAKRLAEQEGADDGER